jgi:hypothetical protein
MNRRQGDLGRSLLVSSALFVAEVIALRAFVEDGQWTNKNAGITVVVLTPILQMATSTYFASRR